MRVFDLTYIIEDDPITSTITELMLRRSACFDHVQKFENGQEAFDGLARAVQANADIPDLILLDLNMPVMDGWEFLDAFSALGLRKHVDVCVLTSSIDPEDIEKSSSYKDVKGYFSKPLDDEVLDKMLHLLTVAG